MSKQDGKNKRPEIDPHDRECLPNSPINSHISIWFNVKDGGAEPFVGFMVQRSTAPLEPGQQRPGYIMATINGSTVSSEVQFGGEFAERVNIPPGVPVSYASNVPGLPYSPDLEYQPDRIGGGEFFPLSYWEAHAAARMRGRITPGGSGIDQDGPETGGESSETAVSPHIGGDYPDYLETGDTAEFSHDSTIDPADIADRAQRRADMFREFWEAYNEDPAGWLEVAGAVIDFTDQLSTMDRAISASYSVDSLEALARAVHDFTIEIMHHEDPDQSLENETIEPETAVSPGSEGGDSSGDIDPRYLQDLDWGVSVSVIDNLPPDWFPTWKEISGAGCFLSAVLFFSIMMGSSIALLWAAVRFLGGLAGYW